MNGQQDTVRPPNPLDTPGPTPADREVELAAMRDQASTQVAAAQRELADIRAQVQADVQRATENLQQEEQAAQLADQRRRTELEALRVQRAGDLADLERQMNAQLAQYEDAITRGGITVQNPNASAWAQGQAGPSVPSRPAPFPGGAPRNARGGLIVPPVPVR